LTFGGGLLKADVTWIKDMRFLASSDSKFGIVVDIPEEGHEGERIGPGPMELMLIGVGACTASDVVWILRKQRVQLQRLELHLQAERASTDPKMFTKIHIEYLVAGKGLKEKAVATAIRLSHEKYCSATNSVVRGGATITASHRIVEAT
jgi:putative redox protein